MPQHAIDAVGRLPGILDEQDRLVGVDRERRALESRDHRQIAAGQAAPGPTPAESRRLGRIGRERDRVAVVTGRAIRQCPQEVFLGERLHALCRVVQAPEGRGPVEGDEAGTAVECQMEAGDVGEPDQDLGVCTDLVVVQPVEDSHGAIATPCRDDGLDLPVGEGLHELLGAPLVGAGEIALLGEQILTHHHPEAPRLQTTLGLEDSLFSRVGGQLTRWRDEHDGVAGL